MIRASVHAMHARSEQGDQRAAIVLVDAAATERVGSVLAALVRGGDVVALVGDLGAGKTTLVTGLVAALGGGAAASPTFALVNEYRSGRLVVWHADLYRLERESELEEVGLDDVLGNPGGVALVEWADRFDVMPRDHLRIELAHGETTRELRAVGSGPRGRELAGALVAELLGSER